MKKFGGLLNKLTSSGKFEGDSLRYEDPTAHSDEEELSDEPNYKKSFNLAEERNIEEPKFKKSFSLRSLSPFKPQESLSMDTEDDFSKKKTSSLRTMPAAMKPHHEKEKDKLHESEGVKKPFSLRSVSLFKSQDNLRSSDPTKSPSLRGIFTSQYEQHRDFAQTNDFDSDGDSEGDDDAQAVPKRSSRRPRVNSTHDDFDIPPTSPVRVPASPAQIPLSPARVASPIAHVPSPATSPTARVPTQLEHGFTPISPSMSSTLSPSTQSRMAADDFDAQFGRMRTDSITDDYGTQYGSQYGRVRADSTSSDVDDDLINSGGSSLSLFPSLSNKRGKLYK